MHRFEYIDSQQRQRHQVIDRAVEASYEALRTESIARQLGRRVDTLLHLLDCITIPNTVDGVVIPTHRDDSRVEIVALGVDEVARRRYQDMTFNQHQIDQLQQQFGEHASPMVRDQADYYYSEDDTLPLSVFTRSSGVAATTFTTSLPRYTTQGRILMRGRPLVLINADQPANRHPALFLHELTHVDQTHRQPVINIDEEDVAVMDYNDELEAYHVTAQIIRGQDSSVTQLPRLDETISRELLLIDRVRQQHCDQLQPFTANQQMMQTFAQHNIKLRSTST